LFQSRLSLKQTVERLFKLLLVEQLTAHNAVDLCAQFGNAIFVGRPINRVRTLSRNAK
jgi:hypothetical protein